MVQHLDICHMHAICSTGIMIAGYSMYSNHNFCHFCCLLYCYRSILPYIQMCATSENTFFITSAQHDNFALNSSLFNERYLRNCVSRIINYILLCKQLRSSDYCRSIIAVHSSHITLMNYNYICIAFYVITRKFHFPYLNFVYPSLLIQTSRFNAYINSNQKIH